MQETQVWSLDREIPWRREWQPSPVFLPGESHGQWSLAGYNPWGHKQSGMTKQLTLSTLLGSKTKMYAKLNNKMCHLVLRLPKPSSLPLSWWYTSRHSSFMNLSISLHERTNLDCINGIVLPYVNHRYVFAISSFYILGQICGFWKISILSTSIPLKMWPSESDRVPLHAYRLSALCVWYIAWCCNVHFCDLFLSVVLGSWLHTTLYLKCLLIHFNIHEY